MAIRNIGILDNKKPAGNILEADKEIAAKKNRVLNAVAPAVNPVVKPNVLPPVVTPKVTGMTDAQKASEAEFRQVDTGGLVGTEQQAPQPIQQAQQPTTPAIDTEATRKAIRDRERQMLINRFQSNLAGTTGEIQAARSKIEPKFRGLTSGVQTQDTMNRERSRKLATGFGPSGSGFLGQSGIAQNVITGGRLGELDVQKSEEQAMLDRQQIEAQRLADLGIAEAEAGFDIAEMQSRLQSEEAQLEFQRQRQELAESREYDDYIRQVEKADETEILQEKNRLLQENKLLDAEIEEAQSLQDFAREKELAGRKAWIATQLEGVKQANRLELEGARGTADAEQQAEAPQFTDKVIRESLEQEIALAKDAIGRDPQTNKFGLVTAPGIEFTAQDEQRAVKNWIVQNVDALSEEQGNELVRIYNLDRDEIVRLLEGGISPGGQ